MNKLKIYQKIYHLPEFTRNFWFEILFLFLYGYLYFHLKLGSLFRGQILCLNNLVRLLHNYLIVVPVIYTDPQRTQTPKIFEKGELTPNPWENKNFILGNSSLNQLRQWVLKRKWSQKMQKSLKFISRLCILF